ncbi:MAG: glucose-6-phosphate isomerase [Lachnospiraceae bacterium]|nr:glucose-6-phosphate isomerase [Lachnospiraceae bacterium]
MIKLNFEKAEEVKNLSKHVAAAKSHISDLLAGKIDMTGWVDHPIKYDKEEFSRIVEVANEIKNEAEVLVSIGIGGSYLGAKAAIEYLSDYYSHRCVGGAVGASTASPKGVEVIFAGNGLSEKYLKETLDYVAGKNFYINVISKSGGTLEPATAFDKFKELCEKKYGKDGAKKRIIATTDKAKGILKEEADREGYRTFVVPDDIGGRYSVLSAVGLLPIAAAGFDIAKLMKGAETARSIYTLDDENKNDAMKYAIVRNLYYENGKDIEVFSTLSPNMQYFAEWLKQLFGESECKGNKGIFPASLSMTADLHSMGQLMQEGKRNMFETFIMIENDFDKDRVKYNDKFFVNDLNDIALRATEKAHHTGNVPVIEVKVEEQNETTLGELFYFFEMSCAISALILGVNPFNQPGVEEYKKNIKELLK